MATVTTNTSTNRIGINQILDYRIFVVSTYHRTELTGDLRVNIRKAMSSQTLLHEYPLPPVTGNYSLFKYSIDQFVESFDIQRSINGSPATLTLDLFPVKTKPESDPDFNFYYLWNKQYLPVFRRMDYIEIQVAELTFTDSVGKDSVKAQTDFQKLLANPKSATDYANATIASNYRVRFRGFITEVIDEDSAEGGRKIKLQAASMLYYLAMCPFVSNLAIFNQPKGVQNHAYMPNDLYIPITGDQIRDLRTATDRIRGFLTQVFSSKSSASLAASPDDILKVSDEKLPNPDPSRPEETLPYIIGNFSGDPLKNTAALLKKVASDDPILSSSSTIESNIIPLIELVYSKHNNNLGSDDDLFRILNLALYDEEIKLGGSNQLFVSAYSYLLDVLNQWKKGLCYVLFENSSGSIAYERPFLNLPPYIMIDDKRYFDYSYKESASGYITDFFTSPGSPIRLYEDGSRDVYQQPSGFTLDELRRYGYRRPDVMVNPNISAPTALSLYSKTVKSINNASLRTLTCSIPYDMNFDIGLSIYFKEKQLLGYSTELTESVRFGSGCSMNVTLSYLRNVVSISGNPEEVNVGNFSNRVQVSDFPEYIFASNFYSADFKIKTTEISTNLKERERLPAAQDIRQPDVLGLPSATNDTTGDRTT